MQRPGVILKTFLNNKSPLLKKSSARSGSEAVGKKRQDPPMNLPW
jgi:hypothetical protein